MKYFSIKELVDETTYKRYGESCWQFFKPEALEMLDGIREFFKSPCTVNNWSSGGEYQYRGYRPVFCNIGAKQSMHRVGGAFDIDIKGLSAEEARQNILADKDNTLLRRIMRMEDGVSWLHADIKPTEHRIYLFKV